MDDLEYYDRLEESRQAEHAAWLDSMTDIEYADYLRDMGMWREADEYLRERG